jgi:outer membrane protein TolC
MIRRSARFALLAATLAGSAPASAGQLGDLLQSALQHPAVAARRSDAEAARKERDAATAAYLGSGAAMAEDTTFESDRFLGVLNPSAFANPTYARTQFRYGATYTLPIDIFGVVAANREAAKQSVAAADLAVRQETLLKLHATTVAYVGLQAIAKQTDALRLQSGSVAAMVERVTGQVNAGSLGITDLKLAQSELAREQSDQVQLDGEREQTLAALEEASGRRELPASDVTVVPPWPTVAAADTLAARLADAQARAADAQAKSQRRALWPSLAAAADYYQYDGSGRSQEAWGVGARISLPLSLDAHLHDAAARAHATAAHEAGIAARGEAQSRMAMLKARYDSAQAGIAALEKEVDYRRQVAAVQSELASVGAQTTEDALRHERDLYDAQARLAQARAQAVEAWSAAQVLAGAAPEQYIHELDRP